MATVSLALSLRFAPSSRPLSLHRRRPDAVTCRATTTTFHRLDAVAVREEESKFRRAAAEGCNLVPITRSIFSDHLTPVLAYRCLVKEDDREAPSFLFESVEQGSEGTNMGRYSVVAAQPAMEVLAKANKVTVMDHELKSRREHLVPDPMKIPRTIMEQWNPPQVTDGLPDAFCGGWVGFFSYDTVRYVETKKLPFSKAPHDDRNIPDMHLGLYTNVIVFDHVEKKMHVIHWVRTDCYQSLDEAYEDGTNRLESLLSKLHCFNVPTLSSGSIKLNVGGFGSATLKSNMSKEEYKNIVVQAKEHILAGDIFQAVLSQRLERRTFADPFEIYRALRIVNPSPYMAYLQARGCILVASSPEILTRVQKRTVVNRPLAGTIRRGKTKAEDKVLEQLLLSDEKQRAEHIMLVDLGRNDVGKVSKPGSVKVEKLMNIERYSHVMHISSTVTGELRDDLTCWDALRAALPVGTVSGAPKVRAMELIDELEADMRGPYSGGFGGISFNGDMDIALALRTIVFPTASRFDTMYSYANGKSRQEWIAHLQAGAGIVADSKPDDEHQECLNKAAGAARAIDLAESTFLQE
ncbi:Anthranilate synthase alpha subunit 1, chloroplastic [Zea mays]|uniref:anthranilate synthase n=1 Tax=Zea mays TaxID=4577 RepID=A0A3L6EIT2_MAIZE|nr:Anthranilate synthase alpha subunit 1, chloroplastic [Zea mays]